MAILLTYIVKKSLVPLSSIGQLFICSPSYRNTTHKHDKWYYLVSVLTGPDSRTGQLGPMGPEILE